MPKTVLVVDGKKITPKHYEEACQRLSARGQQPKIVHMTFKELFLVPDVSEFSFADVKLIGHYSNRREQERFEQLQKTSHTRATLDEEDALLKKCFSKHMRERGPVGAIVLPDQTFEAISAYGCGYLCQELFGQYRKPLIWTVTPQGKAVFRG